jgi:membrane protein YdbS with pleckstrin-like domain
LTLVVLLVLAALWAVVLVPPLLRSRMTRSADSIGEFHYKLGVLSRTNGNAMAPPVPRSPQPARPVYASAPAVARAPRRAAAARSRAPVPASQRAAKRRGDVLRVLVTATALTMALAYFTGSPALWGVQLLCDLLLAVFVGLWAYARSLQQERSQTVHFLPQPRAPELALRRTASS